MLDTVKINHVQHISFTQSRLTDAVSVILSELLSYEHPSNGSGDFLPPAALPNTPILRYPQNRRVGLAKIEKIPAGPEKTLIFFVKNDTLRKSTQSIA